MDVVHTHQCPELNVHKQLGKGNNYREICSKFGAVASRAYKKVNTTGTDKNLFRLVPMLGHSARVQITAGAPTKGFVQIGARAWFMGTMSEHQV